MCRYIFVRWRIEVIFILMMCRNSNFGKLVVQKMSDSGPEKAYTRTSYPSHSRLDLNEDMDLYIGGAPDDYDVSFLSFIFVVD